MKTAIIARLGILSAFWFCLLTSSSVAQIYTITDLGTLPGGSYSAAIAVNSFGQVAGYSDGPPTQHAILWSKTHGMLDLGTLFSGGPSWAAGINDLGHVTGGSWIDDFNNAAFLWTPAQGLQNIVAVLDGQGGLSISNFNIVVGSTTVEPPEAFVWTKDGGELNLNTTLGGLGSVASGVNDRGQVVGYFDSEDGSFHAYIWSVQSGLKDLGEGQASAINIFENVVGVNAAGHAFLWEKNKGMGDLGTLTGDDSSDATAINFWGQVVGTSTLNPNSRAFLWTAETGMLDLNTLIPTGSGWTLQSATGINIFGQIVGNGQINGQPHGFLLTLRRPVGKLNRTVP